MSLFINLSGLTPQEENQFKELISTYSNDLFSSWIVFNDSQKKIFPKPDVLIFSNSDEGLSSYHQLLHSSTFLICTPSLAHPNPPPESLYSKLRFPFHKESIISLLNQISQHLHKLYHPKFNQTRFHEELVHIQYNIPNLRKTPVILLFLYSIFQNPSPHTIFKIRKSSSKIAQSFDLFCFPDRKQIASTLLLSDLIYRLYHPEAHLDEYHISKIQPSNRIEFERILAPTLQNSDPFFWRLGMKAYKTSDLLPWVKSDTPLVLDRWPLLHSGQYQPFAIDVMARLSQKPQTLPDLINHFSSKRKDICDILNALIMTHSISPSALNTSNPNASIAIIKQYLLSYGKSL